MTIDSVRFSRRAVLASAAAMTMFPRAGAQFMLAGGEAARLLVEQGRYLPVLRFYQSMAPGNASMAWMAAQLAAMTGDEDAAFNIPATLPFPTPDLTGAIAADALETIVQAARSRQIVILNEAHHASRCRAFAGLLASRLYDQGFTVVAAETFDNAKRPSAAVASLNSGAPVTPALGWYLADPVYAEAVRAARRKGFRFAAYEARAGQLADSTGDRQIEAREDGEANNFIADILEQSPKARILVICGYDHVRKAQSGGEPMWFAARLKAKTGIDPLCICQNWGLPPSAPSLEEPALKAILDTFAPTAPVVLFDRNKAPLLVSLLERAADVEVIHPRLAPVDGRPGWLAALPGRKRASFALTALTGPHDLIQAVPANETSAIGAVPSDQYPLKAGAREAVFFLSEGAYEIRLETEDGRTVLGSLKV